VAVVIVSPLATGLLLALATFVVGYVARPVGAFFLGHVGDKFGTKTVLVFTLILMALRPPSVGRWSSENIAKRIAVC
jgi:MFS family permease